MAEVINLYPLIADQWKMDGGVAFGVVPKSIWNRNQMSDENNMIPIVTRCVLVKSEKRLILLDAGMGNKRDEKYYQVRHREPGIGIIQSLKQIGVTPADITDVIFTHLHDDHVGGATRLNEKGKAVNVFPHAHYYCSESQWEWAMHPNKREGASYFTDNLRPLIDSGRLTMITREVEQFPGVMLKIFNGHTMGQLIPHLYYKGRTIVFAGDFIPTAFNLPLPFVPAVDIQPLLTMEEKTRFLEEAEENQYILLFEHDYYNECCTLKKTEKGIQMHESLKLNSIF